MKSLVWTRSHKDWGWDKQILQDFPLPVIHLPCLKIDKKILPIKNLDSRYLIVTSPKAIKVFMENDWYAKQLPKLKGVLSFGKKTAELLRNFPVASIRLAGGNGRQFAENLIKKFKKGEAFVYAGTSNPAFDMVGFLRQNGFAIDSLVLYETIPGVDLESEQIRKLSIDIAGGLVCFASPSAVHGFVEAFAHLTSFHVTEVLVIGPTTRAAAVSSFATVYQGSRATIEGLVDFAKSKIHLK